jgi:hypothetical protein
VHDQRRNGDFREPRADVDFAAGIEKPLGNLRLAGDAQQVGKPRPLLVGALRKVDRREDVAKTPRFPTTSRSESDRTARALARPSPHRAARRAPTYRTE